MCTLNFKRVLHTTRLYAIKLSNPLVVQHIENAENHCAFFSCDSASSSSSSSCIQCPASTLWRLWHFQGVLGYLGVSVSHQTFRTLTLLFFFFFLFFIFLFFFLFFFFLFFFFFFFFFSCTVSNFNILKTLTLSGRAGLFGCISNPSNYDMDYRIFNMCMWSFCMYTHIGGGGWGGGGDLCL